ncbi:unnamed protein product [Paramecium pentaurelia]|uniref:Uncharacterized protein n=1 Tax=Paramecium pentaurelia TaxID=43138 RepID=A0A8S1ULV0_9CILI|nr:unnamed protein product [Paramecium pentaurelia]
MDDECIQLKDVPIYRPKNLVRQVTLKEEPNSPPKQNEGQQIVNTQNLFEQLIDQFVQLIQQQSLSSQHIINIFYQILLNVGWSIFNRSTVAIQLDKSKIIKHQCIYFYQRLRKYFQQNSNETLNGLLMKLQKLQYNQDQEDEHIQQEVNFYRFNTMKSTYHPHVEVKTQQSCDQNEEQQKELELRNQKLKELQIKLDCKDNIIKDMTQGYLKDVQHMKELLFRKNDQQLNIFEVQYFDSKEGFTEEQTNLLNQKIKSMQQQFEHKYLELTQTIQHISTENKQYVAQIDKIKDKLKIHDTSAGLLAKVIQMDNNDPYITWKNIQDLKGNQYFFQVFENQKHTYGINYREIDKLIIQCKSQQREVQHYRQQLEDQLSQFVDRQINYIKDLQGEIDEKNELIEKQKNHQKEIVQDCLKSSREQMEIALSHRKNEMLQQLFGQFNELNEIKTNFDQYKVKVMFNKWILINRMLRCVKTVRDQFLLRQEIKEIVVGRKDFEDKLKEYKNKKKKKRNILKTQYEELKQIYENDKYNQIYWEYKFLTQQKVEQILNQEISLLQQQYNQSKENYKILQLKYQVACLHYQQLYRLFDSKQINFDKLDKNQIKMVEYKLKQSDQNKEHLSQQIALQQYQQLSKQEVLFENIQSRSKYCQTVILNVNTPIQNNSLNYEIIEKIMKLKLSVNETSHKQTNTEFEYQIKREIVTKEVEVQCFFESISTIQQQQSNSHCKSNLLHQDQLRSVQTPSQLCLLEEISEQQVDTQQFQNQHEIKIIENQNQNILNQDNTYLIFQRNSLKFTKEDFNKKDYESQLLYDQNRLQIKTPQTPLQASLRVKDQIEKISYLSSNNKEHSVDQQQDIFQRLYRDSMNRKQRLQILKNNIETLDQFKWEQILQIIQSSPLDQARGLSQKSTKRPQMYYSKQKGFKDIEYRFSDQEKDNQRRTSYKRTGTQNNRTFQIQNTHQIQKQNTTFDFSCNKINRQNY